MEESIQKIYTNIFTVFCKLLHWYQNRLFPKLCLIQLLLVTDLKNFVSHLRFRRSKLMSNRSTIHYIWFNLFCFRYLCCWVFLWPDLCFRILSQQQEELWGLGGDSDGLRHERLPPEQPLLRLRLLLQPCLPQYCRWAINHSELFPSLNCH